MYDYILHRVCGGQKSLEIRTSKHHVVQTQEKESTQNDRTNESKVEKKV